MKKNGTGTGLLTPTWTMFTDYSLVIVGAQQSYGKDGWRMKATWYGAYLEYHYFQVA